MSLLFLTHSLNAQVILYGLHVSEKGKVEFTLGKPNYTGMLTDTAYVECENERRYPEDWRNVMYDFLNLMDYPDEAWTMPSNGDPSRVEDTIPYEPSKPEEPLFAVYVLFADTVLNDATDQHKEEPEPFFRDEIDGLKLTDTTIAEARKKLEAYICENYGRLTGWEERHQLYMDLSYWDTVIEKHAVYDYLVDELVFYSYEANKLTAVAAYHWDLGAEFDSLQYDTRGNLKHLVREKVGSIRYEYCFDYNDSNQLVETTCVYGSAGSTRYDPFIKTSPEVYRFEYDASGTICSKSGLKQDGTWVSCFFGRKIP